MEELEASLSSLSEKLDTHFYYVIEDGSGIYEYFIYEEADNNDRLWFSILPDEEIGYVLSLYEYLPHTHELNDVCELIHSKNFHNLLDKMEDEYLRWQ